MAKRNPEAQPSAPSAHLMPPQLMPAVSQFKWNPSLQTGPIQAKILQFWPNKSTNHLKEQAAARGISEAEVDTARQRGVKYDDPDYVGGTVYFDPATGVAVCTTKNGTVTTCYRRNNPKPRWVPK